jgi:multiple sugar transport system ATP-binding protein
MNFFEGSLRRSEGKSDGSFTFSGSGLSINVQCNAAVADGAVLGVRPHHIEVAASEGGDGMFRAEVAVVEPMGNEQIVYATLADGKRVVAIAPPEPLLKQGEVISISVRSDSVHVFDAESGARLACRGK